LAASTFHQFRWGTVSFNLPTFLPIINNSGNNTEIVENKSEIVKRRNEND